MSFCLIILFYPILYQCHICILLYLLFILKNQQLNIIILQTKYITRINLD